MNRAMSLTFSCFTRAGVGAGVAAGRGVDGAGEAARGEDVAAGREADGVRPAPGERPEAGDGAGVKYSVLDEGACASSATANGNIKTIKRKRRVDFITALNE